MTIGRRIRSGLALSWFVAAALLNPVADAVWYSRVAVASSRQSNRLTDRSVTPSGVRWAPQWCRRRWPARPTRCPVSKPVGVASTTTPAPTFRSTALRRPPRGPALLPSDRQLTQLSAMA